MSHWLSGLRGWALFVLVAVPKGAFIFTSKRPVLTIDVTAKLRYTISSMFGVFSIPSYLFDRGFVAYFLNVTVVNLLLRPRWIFGTVLWALTTYVCFVYTFLKSFYMYIAAYIGCLVHELDFQDAVAMTGCCYTAIISCAVHSFDELCVWRLFEWCQMLFFISYLVCSWINGNIFDIRMVCMIL